MTSLDVLCRLGAIYIIRMKFHKNKLLTIGAAVALTLAVAACSSNGDDGEASLMNDTSSDSGGDTGAAAPTLESVQTDAATAATEAQTAATAAQTAANAAEKARGDRAAIQTGDFLAGNSGEFADKAQEHADVAQLAADAAKTASDDAADATDVSSATRLLVMAEDAQTAAEELQMYAETARDNAMTAAAGEISIDDKTKTVDGTSITIDEKEYSETINNVTKHTGLLKSEKITTLGAAIEAIPEVTAAPDAVPPVAAAAAIPGALERLLDIGFTYDSEDDDARVTLVHSYEGTKTVSAFARDNTPRMSTKAGMVDDIDHDDDNTTDPVSLPLKAAGSFYRASHIETGTIGATEKATSLYYYELADGMKVHVESTGSEADVEGVFTYNYQVVTIRSGAKIPDPAMYSHLHFGVWSGLNGKDDGTNTVADLGLGFVANIGEMTSNMPNFGSADYEGNWVANVQAADDDGDGDFSRHDGVASMEANFGKGEVDVTLTGLATLEGTIDGNTFSGTKAALLNDADEEGEAADMLGPDAKFVGDFSGAFFGNLAAEAGGVFAFASDDDNDGANEGGAFRGAFGADQKPAQ